MARTLFHSALMVTLTLGLATAAQQTKPQPAKPTIKHEAAKPISSIEGKDTFVAYCASCHGVDAKGSGPAAPALTVPPPDLTAIAKRHNGKFSAIDVEAQIVGKDRPVTAHGSSEMPIWGPVFQSLSADIGIEKLRLRNLVNYLESIQQK